MTVFGQTIAIVRKNFVVLYRNKGDFISEFLVPLICGIALIAFKQIGVQFLQGYFPIFLPIGALGLSRKILVGFVSEKSDRYKETQKIMGLSQFSYVLGWIISTYLRMLIVFIIMFFCIIAVKDEIKHDSNSPVLSDGQILGAYFLYCFATLNQTLALTTIFSQPKLAGELGSFIQAISAFIYYWLQSGQSVGLYYLFSFLPQCAVNIAISPVIDDFTTSDATIFLLIDVFLYLLLYFYLDQVFPNEFGIKKHPLFFIQCLFKSRQRARSVSQSFFKNRSSLNPITSPLLNPLEKEDEKKKINQDLLHSHKQEKIEMHHIENEHDFSSAKYHEPFLNENNLPQTVILHGLTKYFGKTKAVDNVSFSLYQTQIFGLLGHNGAGKTTLINVLTGLYEKSRGSAKIYGLDLSENIEEIRQYTGLCCQKDVLYDDMTVSEHLEFIANIKGVPKDCMSQEIDFILAKCGLTLDRDKPTKILNGGGKRKLSLGMALIGGSKLVFLDEPTSGLDPISRRGIWKILETLKNEERTIILTTHYLDEAEVLSDRIGVISRGKLLTLGTTNFIKKNFGSGYHLDISKKMENPEEFYNRKDEISQKVLELIKDSKVDPQTTNDVLTFLLPFSSQSQFPALFQELEKYDFINIDMNINSLEDAFVNIGLEEEKNQIEKQLSSKLEKNNAELDFLAKKPTYFFASQFSAIFLRKFYVTFRNLTLFITYIFPIILIIIGTFLCKSLFNSDPPEGATQDDWNFFKRFVFVIFLNVAYSFTSSIYVGLPVLERELNLKYALTVMGCRVLPYWFGTFVFDFLVYFTTIIILMIFLYIEDLSFITDYMGEFIGIMIVYGFSFISFAYLSGFLFEKSNTAYKGFPLIFYFIFATLPWILSTALSTAANQFFEMLFLIISPVYAMNRAYIYLSKSNSKVTNDGLVQNMNIIILIMILQYLAFTTLTIFIDSYKFKKFQNAKKKDPLIPSSSDDSNHQEKVLDVNDEIIKEDNRVRSNKDPIRIVDLTKTYENGFQAIKGVSFGVQTNQIFGLLGPNGAGKSTTFNIITAYIPKTSGSCSLKNVEVNRNMVEIFQDVGICPQFDCLWDNLTPKEHLFLFGRMKGLRRQELRTSVSYFLSTMQLDFFKDTKAGNLSGGNKRKLCVADALIGGPDLLFFDEPSTGLDPIARRFLWKTLSQSLKSRNSSIILTTHSMTEAESLCDNIGIMVNGKLVCFGSTQELKNKYGKGYLITIKPKPNQNIDDLVFELYPKSSKTKNNKEGYVEFQVPLEEFSFFKTFNFLENELLNKELIDDFSISQASLEQIFLQFSKFQAGGEGKEDFIFD